MSTLVFSFGDLPDADLLVEVERTARGERESTARLIALLIEVDQRKLFAKHGYSSLFTYCVQVLHLSEDAAYRRIHAARAALDYPVILTMVADGTLHVAGVSLLAPHLTPANYVAVLDEARYKSKREIEELVARLRPRPDVPAVVRKLPTRKTNASVPELLVATEPASAPQPAASIAAPPTRRPEVKPLAPERYHVQFTISGETHEKLQQVQDLLRHSIPNGDPAEIFDRALTVLLAEISKTKLAATNSPRQSRKPRPGSRNVPAELRREVWRRDGGRCAFIGDRGRCTETGFLEFHHVVPYAEGGEATLENLSLRCRTHNLYEAEQLFGPYRQPRVVREPREPYGVGP